MKNYNSNIAFIDILFNLLTGFTALFIISFILINPIAKKELIDPPIVLIIEIRWNDESASDIDLYAKGPDNNIIYFNNKNGAYMVLEKDDLGQKNETFTINNQEVILKRNYEMITFSQLPNGDYTTNIHYYGPKTGKPETVNVKITQLAPFNQILNQNITLVTYQEITAAIFTVNNNKITNIRTDIQIPLKENKI